MVDFTEKIPSLFEINLNSDKSGQTIFEKLSTIIKFDEGFIYFLNTDSLQLKYSYKNHSNYKTDTIFEFTSTDKKILLDKSGGILSPEHKFLKLVNLDRLNKKSYILAKISIKSTVFGVILLAKKERNFYSENDLHVLEAAACILSYILRFFNLLFTNFYCCICFINDYKFILKKNYVLILIQSLTLFNLFGLFYSFSYIYLILIIKSYKSYS